MDQLKISQTVPTFAVYPDEMKKQFTQYNYLSTSQHIHSSDPLPTAQASSSSTTLPAVEYILSDDDLVIPSSQSTKGKNKRPLTEDDDTDNRLWADSAIKALLAYLSENFSHYRKNKEKFYASAALHIGGKSSIQVRGKLQKLVKKYSEESKEKTGQGTSKWPFYSLMNEIFGNRENVHPECLIDSTGKHYGTNINAEKEMVQRKKKKNLSDDDLSYIKSVEAISESKKLSAENRKKWIEEHSTIECDRFELEKKYRELEYQLKKQEVEARIKVENERLDLDKQMKINFELKLKELETKLNELEMKHK
ncbi:9594_t:CDS:2 [Cetraspora pellucida]|uniref:9594_t:CDS:1 n=1 Tax=Cetraspora pellucida TaxID=1433469 RepID=A0ACA9M184_9GLOM|nr:9594_t:CDS:2 [Cetraspora pellucida]